MMGYKSETCINVEDWSDIHECRNFFSIHSWVRIEIPPNFQLFFTLRIE